MKKKSILLTLIISNGIILAMAVCVAVVNYLGYTSHASKQTDDFNQVIVRQIKGTFDQRMYSINSILLDVSTDEAVIGLTVASDMREKMFGVVKVRDKLGDYRRMYDFLDSVVVYYPKSGGIITNESYYSSKGLFYQVSGRDYWSEEQWEEITRQKMEVTYTFQGDIFSAVCPVTDGKNWGFVIVNSNVSALKQLIQESGALDNCSIAIVHKNTGQVILELGKPLFSSQIVNRLEEAEAEGITSIRDKNYLLICLDSDVIEGSYYFIVPEDTFVKYALDIFTISMTCIILCVGLLIVLILAFRNFKPIKAIYNMVQDSGLASADSGNEIEVIGAVTHKTISRYKELQSYMISYAPALRSRLAGMLLRGELHLSERSQGRYEKIGLYLQWNYFYLILLLLEGTEEDKVLPWLQMRKILEEEFSAEEESNAYTAEVSYDRMVVLVNGQKYSKLDIRKRLSGISAELAADYQITATIVYTETVSSWEELPGLFIQGERALEYQLIRYPGEIVCSSGEEEYQDIYYYPVETENQLLNCVKNGDIKRVNEIMNEIIIRNFVSDNLSLESARCLGFNLIGTAFKVVSALDFNLEEVFEGREQVYQRLLHCRNISEIEVSLRELFQKICGYIRTHKEKHPGSMVRNVIAYLSRHSMEPALSLASVADVFGIHPNYLSTCFKEQSGENFSGYLQMLRLEHAKRLLAESDMPLSEIAEAVGYSNSAVLIRNFKKKEKMTPGQYRENMKK